MADISEMPKDESVISLLGRILLASAVVGLMLVLSTTLFMWVRGLPSSLGLGLFVALSGAVALLGLLCYGQNPLSAPLGIVAGIIVMVIRVSVCENLQVHYVQLADAELGLLGVFLIGSAVARALPDGLWALRICVPAGAFQFIYFRMGIGPGALGRLAFAPAVPDAVQTVWGLAQRPLLGFGAQALDLIFIAVVASMAMRGKLRPVGTFAAIIVAIVAASVLTSATDGPAPTLPWLAALLYLFQAVDYDPLPPIERRSDQDEGPATASTIL